MMGEKPTSICDIAIRFHITESFMFKWDLNIKIMNANSQSCKKSNVDFFTLKSQTLADNIFKCDLNLEKMNVDWCLRVQN